MTNEKKGVPGGTPIDTINGTTPGSKAQWLAEFLLSHIGDREHPLKRPKNASVDRYLRGLISEKNAAGEDVIINLGDGYFRPGETDGSAFYQYILAEKSRAKEILKKVDTMMNTYEEMYGRY